jgi:hypothetical protein
MRPNLGPRCQRRSFEGLRNAAHAAAHESPGAGDAHRVTRDVMRHDVAGAGIAWAAIGSGDAVTCDDCLQHGRLHETFRHIGNRAREQRT